MGTPQLFVLVSLSAAAVAGVLWVMWRMPIQEHAVDRHEAWAPWLALGSSWMGLLAMGVSGLLWFVADPDLWLPAVLLVLDPGSVAAGVLVLWIYRGGSIPVEAELLQKLQARVGIGLGLIAACIGYLFVATHHPG